MITHSTVQLIHGPRRLTVWFALVLAGITLATMTYPTTAANRATELFGDNSTMVRQIRVIDLASGDKFSTGSGFIISPEGLMATNYHVVSSYIHEPEKFRLEAILQDDSVETLDLIAVDVVHDLAIVTAGTAVDTYFALSQKPLSKGDRIYSMGNPLDLGQTIIEGTYNGLVENSRYRKILFSGSLNPGMSGGPALNTNGEVIGINVSKGGEQISFLVPVAHLATLLKDARAATDSTDFSTRIAADLMADQQRFYDDVIANMNSERALGELQVPKKLHPSLNCWGHSVDEEDIRYEATHQHCQSEDAIFVSREIYLGSFRYSFEFAETEELNRFQFYKLLESRFMHRPSYVHADEDEITPYRCHDDKLSLASGNWKVSTCMRSFRELGGLLEVSMVMASLDYPDKAAVVKVSSSGISRENAFLLLRSMAEAVAWKR